MTGVERLVLAVFGPDHDSLRVAAGPQFCYLGRVMLHSGELTVDDEDDRAWLGWCREMLHHLSISISRPTHPRSSAGASNEANGWGMADESAGGVDRQTCHAADDAPADPDERKTPPVVDRPALIAQGASPMTDVRRHG